MALALFKKSQPAQPARDLLRAHLAETQSLQLKRQQLSERDARARVDRDAGAASAERVAALSQAIDQSTADLRYGAGSTTDLPTLRQQLVEAEAQHAKIEAVARAAAIVSQRYTSELSDLSTQAQSMSVRTGPLLKAALLEVMQQRRERFEKAKTELRAALNDVLAPATAHDALAEKDGTKKIGAEALFAMSIPDPFIDDAILVTFEQQHAHGQKLAAEHAAFEASMRATITAGSALANALLNGEASAP